MKIIQRYTFILATAVMAMSVASCNKILDIQPKDVVDESQMYRGIHDADAAVLGIYGKVTGLAETYVVLNELRADLMTTTANLDENLRQVNEHAVQEGNTYANPRPFYEVILDCNDVMFHLKEMLQLKKIKIDEYNQRYSDVAAMRCWLYLQLGIQFGKVPYVTSQLSQVGDINAVAKMQPTAFAPLLDSLTATMDSLPYMQTYAASSSIITEVGASARYFVNKKALQGELYLWQGRYNLAAKALKSVMETGGTGSLDMYKVRFSSKADNNDIAVGYVRYRELDENMLINNNSQGWRAIFALNETDAMFGWEWVWYLPFNKDAVNWHSNPFIRLFSNRGGSYLVKPAQLAIDNWNSQTQLNNFPYDARGKVFSWRSIDGQPVIMKYLYNYFNGDNFTATNPLSKPGKFFLYRAAELHLQYAEAANRDNHKLIATALLNKGIPSLPGGISTEGDPYNFDARNITAPRFVGDWTRSAGIRGRAYLTPATFDTDSSVVSVENRIIEEAGLELAFEGHRWPDLVRIALRRNDPAFLADKVYAKLVKENNGQAAAVRTRLMNKDNWYLPFKWQ
jgi:hypothetical protein